MEDNPCRSQLSRRNRPTWLQRAARAGASGGGGANHGEHGGGLQSRREGDRHHRNPHAVDLDTGALLAVTLLPATDGDTKTVPETLAQCGESICEVAAETQ